MTPDDRPPVRLELDNEWAWCGPRRLELTPRAFAVLRYLVDHAERLLTKEELLTAVWGDDTVVGDAALASCIRDLRRALGDSPAAPRYIETVHRRGFRFIGPVARPAPPATADADAAPAGPAPTGVPALVGREAELGRLRRRMARALRGERQVVFVTGEPGIGKTALVDAFLAGIAGEHGIRVGRGQCVEQYGAGEPYLPVLEALGRLGQGADGEPLVQVLRQHAPTWLLQLPALLADRDVEAAQRRAEGATRDRMLREVVDALDALAAEVPLVLVLEDLHWSDSATIDLLAMVARRRERARLLVLGTYRASEVTAASHPLRPVTQELQSHGHCEVVPLEFLGGAAVHEYLAQRFPGHAFPPALASVLHRNTEGSPLFLVNAVDDLLARGRLRRADGRWTVEEPLGGVPLGAPETLWQMPETLWQMVEGQVERLAPEEQSVLAVASVAGVEFSAAIAIAGGIDPADGEERCQALARRGQFLRAAGVAEWPDRTLAGRYAFIHALYQQVLYARVTAGQRVSLHLRTAERLERGYGARAAEIAGELAMHFEQGRDLVRAARYRRHAGEHALRRHGYREAAEHAARGLELLADLPAPARAEEELGLLVIQGAVLTATRGYAAPETAQAYERARVLCASAPNGPQVFPALLGLGRCYVVRGDFDTARAVAAQLLSLAAAAGAAALRLAAHNAAGIAAFYAGDFEGALAHLERAIALYDPQAHGPHRSALFRLGQDPGVSCTTHAAWALWMLGYPDRAAARTAEAVALARSLGHPFSLSYACHFGAGLHQWRGDHEAVRALEDEALPLDTEHGFELFLTAGQIQRGWLLAARGGAEEGLAEMRRGLARHRAIGALAVVPAYASMVVDVLQRLGRPAEALATVTEILADRTGHHYWEAELHRLRGVLLREVGASGTRAAGAAREAEPALLHALESARRQRARSLELRAASSLGRLWAEQGRVSEARGLLAGICGWFTEGAESVDVIEARSLLASLEGA